MGHSSAGNYSSPLGSSQQTARKLSRVVQPTGREVSFDENQFIVSKTDTTGRITYVNEVFAEVAGFRRDELIGAPHSIIRHPDMPRCVFKLLWETLAAKHEIFAYVVNLARNGDHYWVFAHVTPSFDKDGNVIGYHSNRRVPNRPAVEKVAEIYKLLRQEEDGHSDRKAGLEGSFLMLANLLHEKKVDYDEFILAL